MKKFITILLICLCTRAMGQQVYFESNGIVYGVTMPEKGVSKIVSMRLSERA